jgi:hypothetical protein
MLSDKKSYKAAAKYIVDVYTQVYGFSLKKNISKVDKNKIEKYIENEKISKTKEIQKRWNTIKKYAYCWSDRITQWVDMVYGDGSKYRIKNKVFFSNIIKDINEK